MASSEKKMQLLMLSDSKPNKVTQEVISLFRNTNTLVPIYAKNCVVMNDSHHNQMLTSLSVSEPKTPAIQNAIRQAHLLLLSADQPEDLVCLMLKFATPLQQGKPYLVIGSPETLAQGLRMGLEAASLIEWNGNWDAVQDKIDAVRRGDITYSGAHPEDDKLTVNPIVLDEEKQQASPPSSP